MNQHSHNSVTNELLVARNGDKNTTAPFRAQLSYQYAVARTVRLKNAFT